MFLLTNIYII